MQTSAPEVSRVRFTPPPEAKASAKNFRVIAIILWVLAIAAEAAAIVLLVKGETSFDPPIPFMTWLIALIVIDLVLVVIGSLLWKKANHLDPASERDKVKFFLQTQLGVIVAVIAFLPLLILILTNKDLDEKQKALLGVVAGAALVIAGIFGIDFNPLSAEQYSQQVEQLVNSNTVYWTPAGGKFHYYEDCSHVNMSRDAGGVISSGTVEDAAAVNLTSLCLTCKKRAEKYAEEKGIDLTPAPAY
ncbi:MAG: hypothetical protein LBC99_04750 [Spirochaetota bacterium]|nr:hypothetical protein [Spirochaetota bacterium]